MRALPLASRSLTTIPLLTQATPAPCMSSASLGCARKLSAANCNDEFHPPSGGVCAHTRAPACRRYMMTGYQRELTYRRDDFGYSAFGNNDPASSIWLTSFVVKTLAAGSKFVAIDSRVQAESGSFIAKQQNKDGSFNEPGRVIHQDMQGSAGAGIALTVYVTTALLEAGLEADVAAKAVKYIETRLDSIEDVYTTVLAAYCLTLANSDRASEAVDRMGRLGVTEGGMTHWTKKPAATTSSPVTDEAPAEPAWQRYQHQPSTDVEMTGYALLVHVARGDVGAGLGAARWLAENRNGGGGYHSTQDTVVALAALAAYAEATFSSAAELEVTLSQMESGFSHSFTLNKDNYGVLQTVNVPSAVGGFIEGSVVGSGAVLVQAVVSWNELVDITGQPPIVVTTRYSVEDPLPGTETVQHVVCARLRAGEMPVGMAIVTQELFSGFLPDFHTLEGVMAAHPMVKR